MIAGTKPTLDQLADELGVSADSLTRLGVEWRRDAWHYPERSSTAEVVGRNRRFPNGDKRACKGGKRGLCYAPGDTYPLTSYAGANAADPVLVVEGATDTAAALDLGFDAVGRSTATPGQDELGWLAELLTDRHAVVLAEDDEAGRRGARKTADALAERCASVKIVEPPDGVKDLRVWVVHHGCDRAELDAAIRGAAEHEPAEGPPRPVSLGLLRQRHPALREPVIDGLLRRGETMNLIAASKVGKSWLTYDLATSIITGTPWLGAFRCTAGRVLLIDNELHPATIAHRIPKVAAARSADLTTIDAGLDVLSLRGRDIVLDDKTMGPLLNRIEAGEYAAIVLDAWYRAIPSGLNENANADVMQLYNRLDRYAATTGAAWVVVHHASKGQQGDKAVTDVGSGAGAQSRAADAHIVLRPHEEEDHVVLEAAVRSFAPVEPLGLRWDFPLWTPAEIDTEALKGRKTRSEERQDERLMKGFEAIKQHLSEASMTAKQLREATGFGKSRMDSILEKMLAADLLKFDEIKKRGQPTREYSLA
ncbi:MAG: AAA family ATPase [Planctomycetota bacterium]